MGVKLEKIVKTFYDNLDEGKITGRKCQCCGAVEFPPVLICNKCGSSEMKWMEISGKAKMNSILMPVGQARQPQYEHLMPYCLSAVTIEEGAEVNAFVKGVTWENRDELYQKLPVDCHAIIIQRDGFKTVMFELDEKNNK